jgi:hypothetical protein
MKENIIKQKLTNLSNTLNKNNDDGKSHNSWLDKLKPSNKNLIMREKINSKISETNSSSLIFDKDKDREKDKDKDKEKNNKNNNIDENNNISNFNKQKEYQIGKLNKIKYKRKNKKIIYKMIFKRRKK